VFSKIKPKIEILRACPNFNFVLQIDNGTLGVKYRFIITISAVQIQDSSTK